MEKNQNLKVLALLVIIKGLLSIVDKKKNKNFYVIEATKVLTGANMVKNSTKVHSTNKQHFFFA
ncbi:hypothetical protein H5185_08545 [Shewanella sp. SG44-6]|jgi:uncharacterized membrane protein|uniref:hypothetical protein n=1 Tax=Shewanella sp. SG44-6 TaxID=2760959 RepID=UPI0016043837|nr:hypothetical protein [Shewanella sp. SG44-6]MBB1389469.1 hypothetical protein [Shewanella sp. SG44-6]